MATGAFTASCGTRTPADGSDSSPGSHATITPSQTLSPVPSPEQTSAVPSASWSPARSSKPEAVPDRLSLVGDRANAMAFASLDHPDKIIVEGRVGALQAWSTSKVLVVAAFLDRVADGDPSSIGNHNRELITRALTASDADAVTAIRDQIPGRPGPAMTAVLRSVGDRTTHAPDAYQGEMLWGLRQQVRFMAALARGAVVSRAASSYLRSQLRPIPAHAWGLGRIGATAYKGGWLRADTATRQLGIVDGYAVAIITIAGPAVRQTDGDFAHVRAMNSLASLLADRLAWERAHH